MLSTEKILQKILNLCDNCPGLREGTRHDLIFKAFSNAPVANNDGMWPSVNTTLDAAFGKDCVVQNISKGPLGLPMVVDWVRKAEKHPTWDLNAEMLINIKLDNIVTALKAAGAEDQSDPKLSNKRRLVFDPETSNETRPPVKQPRTACPDKSTAIESNVIILSSDDESNVQKIQGSKNQKHHTKNTNRCKVEKSPGGKNLSCHCGAKTIWLGKGRVRSAEAHWATDICKDKTKNLKNNTQLTSYFKSTTAPNPNNLISVACPGLNDETWERPKATQSIAEFLSKTFSIYRGNHQHEICREIFGQDAQEHKLTKEQKSQLIATLDARSKWQVKRHGERSAIYSSDCKRTFVCKKTDKNPVCSACQEIKELRSLLKALNVKYAEDDDMKYSRNNYMSDNNNAFSPTALKLSDCRLLKTSIESASKVLKDLGYSGPIAAASDQTVCVKRLRHYNGFLVGAQGGDIPFSNASELPELVKSVFKNKQLCSKETSNDILEGHKKFLELSREAGINILSIGADGAPPELSAQASLVDTATQYFTYSNSTYDVHIKLPLVGHPPRPVVMVQDPKHARKTSANQLASGARLLTIGNYHISIQQLAAILQSGRSLLLHRDVFDCDKQDDGRAFRTLSSSTLAVSLADKDMLGLSIYLYVAGEMCDTWLNRSIGHRERIRSAWTAEFFFRHWKNFKIFSTLATSLLQLIIAHREFYPNCPLLPWKHGSEPCEHGFGWMRVLSPQFTVLDARMMMPKLHLIVKNIMSGKMKIPPSEHIHSGYQYAFCDEPDSDNLKILTKFPTDIEISEDLKTAYERANHLVTISGMGSLTSLICDTPDVDLEESYENSPENLSDVSVCATQLYDIEYRYKVGSCPEKEVLEAAANLTKEQNAINLFLETLPEDSESESLKNAAMCISNLLNPAPDHHPIFASKSDVAIGPLVINNELIGSTLIAI
ncbi:uncharacterized protein MELLADRAFT_85855 [Melampsora larici-populina 98AG31]|uniref:Uncharacterized protein n=1 Tax=Melampsora larici-populina (strain 98AG31 / pathotype 3-4-7) TaxID=747676 RepID=F4SDD7_MELLP|nr:uncharacterized protein MELLADRAFT_85855 [Melampsora larici-populina 98AG31]EGF97335.1 hypothetical protein MELLADRAFT_85855 [Melampsora larici-populina 98AG31]